jgi:cytochrome c-type biogenesis protein CcmH
MNTFLIFAAGMVALAAAAVAVPLLRGKSWIAGAVAALVIAVSAAALYPLWSSWDWHAPAPVAAAGPDVMAMVAKLEAHMKDSPNDVTGWMMLGRSYLALERAQDAIVAYGHAHQLDGGNAEAALGLGEAMSLQAGGNITPGAGELFEQAVKQAPDNPKALLYSGFAAASRGDNATARSRWLALKELHPPEEIDKMLDARIAELGEVDAPMAAAATSGNAAGAAGAAPGDGASGSAASSAQATVNISIAPELKARLDREAPLFVFAREPGMQGPPLAAKRLTSAAIGSQIHLTAADSMITSRVLLNGHTVSITARVSFSGQPLPAKGDLYGELSYDVGHDGVRNLVIDRVAE